LQSNGRCEACNPRTNNCALHEYLYWTVIVEDFDLFWQGYGDFFRLPSLNSYTEVSNKNRNISIEEVEANLLNFLRSNIVDQSVVADVNTSFQVLKIDSLSIVEMILFLERKYQVTIPETELVPENFKSVKTLAACAHRCLENSTGQNKK
jgi:acyl carrier protein